ncbi:MAG: 3-deoxy-D-manno-octulosonate 8-phosphate phosphatase (KDO 8-P phosphatase) [Paraglaciecola sp.]|jgi:3-deoxy-D-manno-octulosonate 8-phosphate phosphatase (KDO 8-P phosphatase)
MAKVETIYGPVEQSLMQSFAGIKLLACDVDGVFSDGRIYLGDKGEELKAFHTRDGYGIKALQLFGVQVAVITGRRSQIVEQRMSALGVKHILQGCEEKNTALKNLQQQLNISSEMTASIGDDMPDIGMFDESKLSIAVEDAHYFVRKRAQYVCQNKGGFGAVREICDLILHSLGQLDGIHGSST